MINKILRIIYFPAGLEETMLKGLFFFKKINNKCRFHTQDLFLLNSNINTRKIKLPRGNVPG